MRKYINRNRGGKDHEVPLCDVTRACEACGLTLADLADFTGVSEGDLLRFNSGRLALSAKDFFAIIACLIDHDKTPPFDTVTGPDGTPCAEDAEGAVFGTFEEQLMNVNGFLLDKLIKECDDETAQEIPSGIDSGKARGAAASE